MPELHPVAGSPSVSSSAILRRSLEWSLLAMVVVIGGILVAQPAAEAATYSLTGTAPSMNWSTAPWNVAGYPGQNSGDTVNLNLSGYTMNMDVALTNGVVLNFAGSSIDLNVGAGKQLILQAGSMINGSSNFLNVTGGTLSIQGATDVMSNGVLRLDLGTIQNDSTLRVTNTSGGFTIGGGTLRGTGLTRADGGMITFNGSSGTMLLDDSQVLDTGTSPAGGTIVYSSPSSQLFLSGTSSIVIRGLGLMNITAGAVDILAGGPGPTMQVLSGGTIRKNALGTVTNIFVPVDNAGLVECLSGNLGLSGGGTHTGQFNATNTILFSGGLHTLNSGVTFAGTDFYFVDAGTLRLAAGAAVSIPNLIVRGGTLDGPGSLTMTNQFQWRGGTISGTNTATDGAIGVNTTTSVSVSDAAAVLSNRVFNSGTSLSFLPSPFTFTLQNGAQFNVGAGGGSAELGFNFLAGPGGGAINNSSASTFTFYDPGVAASLRPVTEGIIVLPGALSEVFVAWNNSGTLVSEGLVRLWGGGTHTGAMNSNGNTIEFAGGTHNFNTTSTLSGGSGTYILSGSATLNVNTTAALSCAAAFQHQNGTLTGPQDFVSTGTYTWSGGSMTGNGKTQLNGGSTFDGVNGAMVINARTVISSQPLMYTAAAPNFLAINNGGTFENGATFTASATQSINSDGVSSPSFQNAGGTLNLTDAGGLLQIYAPLANTAGGIVYAGGPPPGATIEFLGGGSSNAATFTAFAPFDKIAFRAGAFGWGTGTIFSGQMVIAGADVSATAPQSLTTLALLSGNLGGAATVTVSSDFTWLGGSMDDGGTTDATATFTSSGAGLLARTLTNRILKPGTTGSLELTPAAPLSLNNASRLENGGTLSITGDGNVLTNGVGANQIINTGSLMKTGGTAGTGTRFDVPIANNAGTIGNAVANTSFIVGAGGSSAGIISTTDPAAAVDFFAGTFTSGPTGTFAGGGITRVNGGTLDVQNNVSAARLEVLSGTLSVATTKTLTTNALQWTGGTISGGGSTDILISGTIGATSPLTLGANHSLLNHGAVDYLGDNTNFLTTGAGSQLRNENNATFNVKADGLIAGSGTLQNAGNLLKTNALGVATISLPVTSIPGTSSSIGSNSGTLRLNGGGTITSPIQIGAGAFLEFQGGTFNVGSPAAIAGTGTVQVSGGAFNANTPLTFPSFNLSGGSVGGTAAINVRNGIWSGGDFAAGGTLTFDATGTFDVQTVAAKNLQRNATNNGTLRLTTAGAAFTMGAGAVLTNNTTLQLLADANVLGSAGRINNIAPNGLIEKSGGAGTSQIDAEVWNDDLVSVGVGTLGLGNSGQHAGMFTTAANTVLGFGGTSQVFSGTSQISGVGTVKFAAANTTFGGSIYALTGAGTTIFESGTTTFNTPAQMPIAIFRAIYNGGGPLTITGNPGIDSEWRAGTIAGPVTIAAGAKMQINGAVSAMALSGATLTSNGTLLYNPPSNELTLIGATIVNNSAFDLVNDRNINVGAGSSSITNNGTFRRTAGAATAIVAPSFTNTNSVLLQAATTSFIGGFTQSAGNLSLAGGNAAGGTFTINGGTVTGSGTIAAALTNGGTILPGVGATTGTISVNSYTQNPTGKLEIDLGGTTAGAQYDVLAVAAQPTLAGTFQANLINGFVPANGNTFNVLTYPTAPATDFTTPYTLPTFAGGSFSHSFTAGALQLVANATGADIAVTQSTPPPAYTGDAVVYTITVTNSGTVVANAVALNNTFSGPATLAGATTTVGSCTGANCTIGNLGAGASATVTLTLTATGPGTISNTAAGSTSSLETNTANNTGGPTTVVVSAKSNVGVGITDSPDPVNAGANITYNATFNNAGPDAGSNPSITFNASNGTIVSTGGPITCTGSGASRTCSAAGLPLGGTLLVVTVQAGASGSASLSAAYTSSTFDPDVTNNNALQSTAITPVANDVQIVKTGPATVIAGTQLVYTLTITNNGAGAATGVTVDDPTPAGLLFSFNSGACTTAFPCSLGTLGAGASATITSTYDVPQAGGGSVTNNATVASTSPDSNAANNSSSVTTSIARQADIQITKSGPASTSPGAEIEYAITVRNNGPSQASTVIVDDPTPAQLSLVSITGGGCTSLPCNLGTLVAGQSAVIFPKFTVSASASGAITNTATVNADATDPTPANNSSSVATTVTCATSAPGTFIPTDGTTGAPTTGRLFWNDTGAASYTVFLGTASANGCNVQYGTSTVPSIAYSGLQPNTTYRWKIVATSETCPERTSICVTFTTSSNCSATVTLSSPLGGTHASPITFAWQPVSGATEYAVLARVGTGNFSEIGRTAATSFTTSIDTDGIVEWYVVANVVQCGTVQSPTATFTLCNRPATPLARVIGEATSARNYRVEWDAVPNAIRYEIDEATNPGFTGAVTTSTDKTFAAFRHETATNAFARYYRVRAFTACSQGPGDNSPVIRIVIIPLPKPTDPNPAMNVPAGSEEVVVLQVFVPGEPNQTAFFTAISDRPWMTVRPASGVLPPEGITLEVIADPANLPNGTFTATVIVTITTPGAAGITGHGTSTSSKPISISLVTPVTPVQNKLAPSADSLIIPSVGHLDGINSHWQSDIRVTNVSAVSSKYALTFTPSAGTATGIKQTTITVGAGETTALDDIIKNWFGIGSLGDTANGMLEIRSADSAPLTAVASSRTYNVTSNGTLGQYIPALPFSGFVGKALQNAAPTILSMQQISQSSLYRTNVGIVEASGKAASVIMSVFNSAGVKLTDIPFELAGGEQRQLNSILAANNITLNDGRVEVKVAGGDGKVTAYASVVDNQTNDPLLVSGVATNQLGSAKYVLPGVADLTNALANWRTDMRIFNTTLASQTASLTLHQLGGGTPLTASVSLQPGEVRTLDDVVKSLFNVSNVGGAVHVEASNQANLVVTGRTYNQTSEGTFGQFIEAVTPERAVGAGGRTLHVLQVEDSIRYRTNLGIAEVTGSPVTVEVQVVLPDSKVTPTLTFPMAANEFRQLSIIRDLSLGNVYNARLTVKVIDGQGRVTAYGSVIDMTTQDPTYVPAQ